jgi:hypothetical protein
MTTRPTWEENGRVWKWASKEHGTIIIKGKHGPTTNHYICLDDPVTTHSRGKRQAIEEARIALELPGKKVKISKVWNLWLDQVLDIVGREIILVSEVTFPNGMLHGYNARIETNAKLHGSMLLSTDEFFVSPQHIVN